MSLSKFTTLYGISTHQTNLFQVNFGGGLHSKNVGKVQKWSYSSTIGGPFFKAHPVQAQPNTLAIGQLFPEEEETEEKETEMSDRDTKSTLKCVGKSNILVQNFTSRLQSPKNKLILYFFLAGKLGNKKIQGIKAFGHTVARLFMARFNRQKY